MKAARSTGSKLLAGVAMVPALGGAAFGNTDPWALLAAIEIEEIVTDTSYQAIKIFPAEIENGVERFDITGYAVPISDDPDARELILVSDMGFCPFCGSPEHGTSLTVQLDEAMGSVGEGEKITVRGTLEPIRDPETFMSAIMTGGRILRP